MYVPSTTLRNVKIKLNQRGVGGVGSQLASGKMKLP